MTRGEALAAAGLFLVCAMLWPLLTALSLALIACGCWLVRG